MPDLDSGADFVANTDALAEEVNARFDAIEAWANASIASLLADTTTAARLVLGNASGVPTYTAMSGHVHINSSGQTTIQDGVIDEDMLEDDFEFPVPSLPNLPAVRIEKNLTQEINGTEQCVFDVELFDTDTMYDSGTPNRITCKTAGVYMIEADSFIADALEGSEGIEMSLRVNGSSFAGQALRGIETDTSYRCNVSTLRKLAVNDYIELYIEEYATGGGGGLDVEAHLGMAYLTAG